MSNFWDHLLTSSRGGQPAGAVRPRPVARFETPDGAAFIREPVSTPDSPAHTPPTQSAPAAEPVTPAPVAPSDDPVTAWLLRESPRPAADEQRGRHVEPTAPLSEPRHVEQAPLIRRDNDVRPAEREVIQRETVIHEQHTLLPAEPTDETPRVEVRVEPPAAPVEPLLGPQPPPPPPPRSAAPIVKVSIGRIEVNTPAPDPVPQRPAAPRRAPQPRKPVRGLDDYLRRRNGGSS